MEEVIHATRTRTPEGFVTKLDCGCEVIQPLPDQLEALLGRIPEPIWFKCKKHRNTQPENIRVDVEFARADL